MNKSKQILRATLKKEAYLSVNKAIARKVGLDGAAILADLISKEEYFEKKGELDEKGYFYNTQDNIEKDTTLTPYIQRKALKRLKEYNLVDVKKKGMPAKNHFKLFHDKILRNLTTSDKETLQQEVKKLNTNNNKNNNKNKNKEELSKDNSVEQDSTTDVQKIVNYFFDLKGWANKTNAWYKENDISYARYVRPAKQLLELCDNVKNAKKALDKISKWAKEKGLDWSIETCFKRYEVIQ